MGSASSRDRRWTYDVYLSFSGEDARGGFASYLHDRLEGKGIKTFMDTRGARGRGRGETVDLLTAIKESRIAIVVLTPDYAASTWCLEELTTICDLPHHRIIPVFYHMNPSDARHQIGSFGEHFDRHERSGRFRQEKIQQWRCALTKAAAFSGGDPSLARTDLEYGKFIVDEVCRILQPIKIKKRILRVFYCVLIIFVALIAIWRSGIEDFEATTQAANANSCQWKHDVFLSFRGEDTRKGFLSHLYRELQNTKIIRAFKDDEQLKKGKDISQSLLTAIEESRFAIIVLSENYAFSTWCLDELTKIFQCMEGNDTILPIFYHVDPSDVRKQRNRYEVAFTNHSSNAIHATEKVKQWRADLTKVGSLSGWHSKNYKSESELIIDIVKFLLGELLQVPRGDFCRI